MSYWLFEWMDANDIRKAEGLEFLLADPALSRSLRDQAVEASAKPVSISRNDDCIIAGQGIDLSAGGPNCLHLNCVQMRVDKLFSKVALYFDRIILDDPFLHLAAKHWDAFSLLIQDGSFSQYVDVLLLLRRIGAEPYLSFVKKFDIDAPMQLTKQELEYVEDIFKTINAMAPSIRKEVSIKINKSDPSAFDLEMSHPGFPSVLSRTLSRKESKLTDKHLRNAARQDFTSLITRPLISDIVTAQSIGAPLGISTPLHRLILEEASQRDRFDRVAFDLQLPILSGIPADTLLRIRRDESDSFITFKRTLRKALEEKTSNTSKDSKAIQREIYDDLIAPELRKIRTRLSAASRGMKKKAALGFALGTLATTCGVILGIPMSSAIMAGLASLAGITGGAVSRRIDETEGIRESPMYYLWKMQQHAKQE